MVGAAVLLMVWAWMAAGASVSADTSRTAGMPAEPAQTKAGEYTGEGIGGMLVRTILALFVVVVLVYAGVYLLKRLMARPKTGTHAMPVRILGSTLLGPKKVVTLIEVEGRILVLGVTDSTITCLTEFKKPSAQGIGPAIPDAVKPSGMNFGDLFHKLVKKRGSDE